MRPLIVIILPILLLAQSDDIPLVVSVGSPLRVYLTKRLPKRMGEPVHAKLVEPLFAFNKEVVPAGAEVTGCVTQLKSMSKMKRALAILGGDFTPLHQAEVEFGTLILPDGRHVALRTQESTGLNTIVPLHPRTAASAPQGSGGGVLGTGKRQAQAQIDAAKEKIRGMADMIRGSDKKENLENFIFAKLPYHPQWVKRGTRFDAELTQPLQFGSEKLNSETLRAAGSQPPPDSIAHVRLLTGINSNDAEKGSAVVAVLTQPMFSAEHELIFPEGTRLIGSVTAVRPARWFHRGGQLRFNFQNVEWPPALAQRPVEPNRAERVTTTQATVISVEQTGTGKVKVDKEGSITATESKTRFIAPAISAVIAHRAADNDRDRNNNRGEANVSGRTLGGASGFGMLGALAAQGSRTVGTVFGFWGMAASVYTNIIAKGTEAEFDKNAAMDVRFGGRSTVPAMKVVAGGSY